DQMILIDREKADWPADDSALHSLWRQQIKDEVLRLKLAGRETESIQELLEKRYANQQSACTRPAARTSSRTTSMPWPRSTTPIPSTCLRITRRTSTST